MQHVTLHFIRDLLVENSRKKRLEAQLYRFSKINIREDFHFPEHKHSNCEIIIPLSDKYECKLNGTILSAAPGELLMIQPGDLHEDFYHREGELIFIVLTLSDFSGRVWTGEIMKSNVSPTQRTRLIEKNSATSKILEVMLSLASGNPPGTIQVEKLAEAFFWEFISSIPQDFLSDAFKGIIGDSAFQNQISSFFMSKLKGQLDVNELAATLGMSKRALEYKFRESFNSSPVQTFTAYKMTVAEQMLRQGASVKAAAAELGFKDQFYFSTAFKRIKGVAPSRLSPNS